jgi:DNA modification methylase
MRKVLALTRRQEENETPNSRNMSLAHQKVTERPVGDLTASPNNPHVHSLRQIQQIKKSIERFGFVNPVLIDSTNQVIAGWGRVLAARSLKMKEVPTLKIEHLNREELRAYVIADNRLAEKAGWDKDVLALELQGLLDIEFDMDCIGFEPAELDIILEEALEATEEERPEDLVSERASEAVTRLNDVWICGAHRLLCADARSAASYDVLLGNDKASLVITDPPYNVPVQGHVSGLGKTKHREFAMASGEMTTKEFTLFLDAVFENMSACSRNGSVHFVFMDWRHIAEIMEAGTKHYQKLLNLCVWCKTNAGMGSFYRSQHELIFAWLNGSGSFLNNVELGRFGRSRSNVWTYPGVNTFGRNRSQELRMHPTVKPTALVSDAIKDCSRRNDIVLDPFLGSGTTLIACEKTGRRAFGMEIDPLYVDVAVRRWQAYTGKNAIHQSGRSFEEITAHRTRVRIKETNR